MTTQTETTAWPEGVIARYLTVGSAIVDITQTQVIHKEGDRYTRNTVGDLTLTARCDGCLARDEYLYEGLYLDLVEPVLANGYSEEVREWAQAHAETCRTMTTPTL